MKRQADSNSVGEPITERGVAELSREFAKLFDLCDEAAMRMWKGGDKHRSTVMAAAAAAYLDCSKRAAKTEAPADNLPARFILSCDSKNGGLYRSYMFGPKHYCLLSVHHGAHERNEYDCALARTAGIKIHADFGLGVEAFAEGRTQVRGLMDEVVLADASPGNCITNPSEEV